jgi:triacylglycerol lipase
VSYKGHHAEGCCLVLPSPPEATAALLVVLPLALTNEVHGLQRWPRTEQARRLAQFLRHFHQTTGGRCPIYYLASVPAAGGIHEAELALALTSLGWPPGIRVLLPTNPGEANSTLAAGIDRLRWLFAGALEVSILNLEAAATRGLMGDAQGDPDRAVVRRLVEAEEDLELLFEGSQGAPVGGSVSVPRSARADLVPRFPVVFCHGMLATSTIRMRLPEELNCFAPLKPFLQERACRALFPEVLPTGGVVERAKQLREQIVRYTDEPVNLVAHSMGGLDARYLITHLGMAERVRSLTTICTPHRGTYLADWVLTNYRNRFPLLMAFEALGVNVDGFRDCRPAVCREFNERTPDMAGVHYFSFGGTVPVSRVSPALRRCWHVLATHEGPNDGMVSLQSARWGEYLGTVHADHFAQTPDATFVRLNEDFDSLGFCTRLVENLARRGF